MTGRITRREFVKDSGTLALGGPLIVPFAGVTAFAETADTNSGKEEDRAACNFSASFMTWDIPYRKDPRPYARHNVPYGNMARIQLEALIDVIDLTSGQSEKFVLIAPCRTEWVYAAEKLFQIPSAEFRNIYSKKQKRSMSSRIIASDEPSRGGPLGSRFRSLKIDLRSFGKSRELSKPADIVAATLANMPLVARTQIDHPDEKYRYLLEYPIKTMNVQPKDNSFQVDTGPVLVADFHSKASNPIDTLEMAYVAYNQLDRAEFIVRRPTPITDKEGKEISKVLHYSEIWEDPAHTRILTGEESK